MQPTQAFVCRAVGVALVGLLLSTPASAAPIFSRTPIPNTGGASDRDSTTRMADDFTLSSNDTVRSVIWRGLYTDGTPQAVDDFNINFYSDSAGLPGALLQSFAVGNAVNRVDTGTMSAPCCSFFEYSADLGTGIALLASTTYHLSISNDTTSDVTGDWLWAVEFFAGGDVSFSFDSGATWSKEAAMFPVAYFILDNANASVPEPSTGLLLVGGLAALVWRRRKAS